MADWTGLVTNSTGFYSGLNISQIVSAIVQADSQPLTDLQKKVSADNAQISAYGSLLSSLSSMNTLSQSMELPDIYGMAATSSDSSVLTGTAGSTATAGSYSITVSKLAQAQSTYSAGFASETSTAIANSGDTGFQIQSGNGNSATITYDSTNNVFDFGGQTYSNSLDGAVSAINAASQANSLGVSASVINNGSTYQLVISSSATGAANRFKVMVDPSGSSAYGDANGTAGINQLAFDPTYNSNGSVSGYGTYTNMQQSMAGLDANLSLNGISVTRSSNTISDLVSGVTLNLLQTSASPVNLTVANDNAGFTTQINSFISTYNTVMSGINKALGTQSAPGSLYGDNLTQGLRESLYNMTTTAFNGTSLAGLGITHDDTGNLALNTTVWNAALAANPNQALGAINQMATSLQSTMNTYMNNLIPNAESGLNSQISLFQQQEQQQQDELNIIQQTLTKEFQNMEQTLGTLNQNSTSMSNMLSSSSSTSTSSGSTTGGTAA
ncbi:MAG: flagellar filament capping protein FliD [Nitrospiraceae bacterium]|nr:flagellar filament capping protein FliD [Nitrospiraceae bacterium]